jgi:predicted nucleic acid-binding protein
LKHIFVDTDVILDLLSAREPHYIHAAELFTMADEGKVQLFVSSLCFANINYILSRQYSSVDARKKLLAFKTLVTVLPVDDKTIELALASDFKDFEDAIQYYTAIEGGLEILVTRNLKDFKKASITILTAQQYLRASN